MTFKVEAGKRYIRRDGSVMRKPLETSTHADLRSKYPFLDPEIPTHIKTNGVALAGSNGQFDLVSLYEEHKMPELDLTKPLRIRREVTYDPYRGERFYYSGVNAPNDGRLAGYVLDVSGFPLSKFMKPEELENIPPEPEKHVRLVYVDSAGLPLMVPEGNYIALQEWCAKVLIWRDENGKTKVEVCDD